MGRLRWPLQISRAFWRLMVAKELHHWSCLPSPQAFFFQCDFRMCLEEGGYPVHKHSREIRAHTQCTSHGVIAPSSSCNKASRTTGNPTNFWDWAQMPLYTAAGCSSAGWRSDNSGNNCWNRELSLGTVVLANQKSNHAASVPCL